MKVLKKGFIIICIAVILALAATVGSALLIAKKGKNQIRDTETVAYVNGSPIVFAELKMAAENLKSQVVTYFYNNYGVSQSEGFWKEEHGGETPNKRLWDLAFEEAVRLKTEQLIMVEYGVAEDISYAAYYKSFIAENERRLNAVKNNEIIYGPQQYTLKTYFDYVHNNRLVELKALINKEATGDDSVDYSAENFELKYKQVRKSAEITEVQAVVKQLKADLSNFV